MKIDRIEFYLVAMPLLYPWRTAYGEDHAIHALLCRLGSGSVSAWGESSPLAAPCYSAEWAGGAYQVARQWLGPAILGKTIDNPQELQRQLAVYKGNPFAKAALDTAWWALHSKIENVSLHQAIGATRTQVPVGADFGVMDSIDQLLEAMAPAVEQGFARVKLKYRPGWDLPMIREVRKAFPDTVVHIDCNSGYTLEALPEFRELDACQLAMIEQPLAHDDLLDHATLQEAIQTPVCLDESIQSLHLAKQATRLKSCQWVNIKPGRVGGLTNAIAIHDWCQAADIPCWVGGMLESAVGSAFCTALAMLDNFKYPADIFPSSRFYAEDLSDPPLELDRDPDGLPAVSAPRILPEPVPERLDTMTLESDIQT